MTDLRRLENLAKTDLAAREELRVQMNRRIDERFRYCPAGSFMMGSPEDEKGRDGDEKQHLVEITKPFLMKTTPVTQGEWVELMGENPSKYGDGDDRQLPVESVSFFDALNYCNALSRKEGLREIYVDQRDGSIWARDGLGYRLPTEAEWEYACRAGTTRPRYGKIDEIAWYFYNSGIFPGAAKNDALYDAGEEPDRVQHQTHPVEQKQPNAWGLYDMLGNVEEWCWDFYGATEFGRVVRGGSYFDLKQQIKASYRHVALPHTKNDYRGFRIVRSILPMP